MHSSNKEFLNSSLVFMTIKVWRSIKDFIYVWYFSLNRHFSYILIQCLKQDHVCEQIVRVILKIYIKANHPWESSFIEQSRIPNQINCSLLNWDYSNVSLNTDKLLYMDISKSLWTKFQIYASERKLHLNSVVYEGVNSVIWIILLMRKG